MFHLIILVFVNGLYLVPSIINNSCYKDLQESAASPKSSDTHPSSQSNQMLITVSIYQVVEQHSIKIGIRRAVLRNKPRDGMAQFYDIFYGAAISFLI